MPLRVLGGMKQQPDHRRRQLKPADSPRFEQSGFLRSPELRQGLFNLHLEHCHESGGLGSWLRFHFQVRQLHRGDPLAPSVGEKAIQAPGGMADMETHGSGPTTAGPEMADRERPYDPPYLLQSLEKRVSYGLQEGRNLGDRATKPDFGLSKVCHIKKIAETDWEE